MGEQTRALRVRSFASFLVNNPTGGAYLQIGVDAASRVQAYRSRNLAMADLLLAQAWTSTADLARVASYKTTLRQMKSADFELLEQHGYETAKWNLMLFVPSSEVHREAGVRK